jgi:uncharacterized protein (DUF3820 family)
MEMPFGKYRGQPIAEIPTAYLKWLLTIDIWSDLRYSVTEELELRREGFDRGPKQTPAPTVDVAGWYRQLSMRFHPDRGGSKEAMQAVNAAKELLERMLK